MAEAKLTEKREAELLAEIRERHDAAEDVWSAIRSEGSTDMKSVAGDPWDHKDRAARKDAGRPCLSLDELGQYFNQVVNDVRANPRAVKFSPTGDGANDDTAEFYADKMREIEYRSQAQVAYTTAFENAVQRSYGWVRLNTRYADKGFDQDIWIEAVPNPDMVLPDPEAKCPASSDMAFCFVRETWRTKEFTKRFPKAKIQSFGDYIDQATGWLTANTVQVAEYWTIERQQRELLQIKGPDGQPVDVFADEIPSKIPKNLIMRSRMVDEPKVMQYLTNGVEILKTTEWAGKYIPLASCFGKVLYIDEGAGTKRKLMSMTRLARDPYMLYCYYRTTEAEVVGMTPRTPVIGYEGQFRGHERDWQESAHQPKAYLEVRATTEATGAQLLPLPQRQPYDPAIQALEIGAEGARRAIQAAMGVSPLPTSAQRRNEKSGIALQEIEASQDRGSFHYVDHFDLMVRTIGVMTEDLMDKVYDTPREVGIRKPDETAEQVRINDPQAVDKKGKPREISTKGTHLVTVSTGPSFESEREAASNFADVLAANPQIFPLIGDLVVKLKNLGPIGDQLADRMKALLPPELRAQTAEGGEPDPAALMGKLKEAQQIIDTLSKELDARTDQIKTEAVKGERDLAKTQMSEAAQYERTVAEIASKERIAALNGFIDLAKAELSAQSARAAEHSEMAMQELGFGHKHAEKAAEIGSKSVEADKSREFQREEGEAGRSHEAEQAERAREAEADRAMMGGEDGA